jgi:hypothetical protein
MQPLQVEIKAGEPIQEADARVESAYRASGATIFALDNLNSFLPISPHCHFFQAAHDGRGVIIVVTISPWDDNTLLTVLNVLLELRMDPDPPGQRPLFRFTGLEPVPPVLSTLFGDSAISDLECRAAIVAQFGKEISPGRAAQFAAVALHLLRECLGMTTGNGDPDADLVIGSAVVRLRAENLAEEGAPLNSLLCLGFLYGEILACRHPYPSRWVRLRDPGQWPVLVFGPPPAAADATGAPPARDTPQIVFNPVGITLGLYHEGEPDTLRRKALELAGRLKGELGADEKLPVVPGSGS